MFKQIMRVIISLIKCLHNYLPKMINAIPNPILVRIDTYSMDGFASAVKHHLTSKYSGMSRRQLVTFVSLNPDHDV